MGFQLCSSIFLTALIVDMDVRVTVVAETEPVFSSARV